jgi:DNA-binding MarR family transcriptional regulator
VGVVGATAAGLPATDAEVLVAFWVNLVQTTALLHTRLAQKMQAELGLAPDEAQLLMRLAAAPQNRLRMAEVSDLLLVSKSGVTRMIDRLIARGLVERSADSSDRRVVYASITQKGKDLLVSAVPAFVQGLTESVAPHAGPAELTQVREKLRKILVGNRAWDAERCEAAFLTAASELSGKRRRATKDQRRGQQQRRATGRKP